MKLEKGMKVRIKSRAQALKQYGTNNYGNIAMPFTYMSYMNAFLNTIVTIESVGHGGQRVTLQDIRYVWHKDMFVVPHLVSFKILTREY